jgi:hypothetical protein
LTRPNDLLDAVTKTPVIVNENRPQGGVVGERRTPHDEEGPDPVGRAPYYLQVRIDDGNQRVDGIPIDRGGQAVDNPLLRQRGQTLDEHRLCAEVVIDQPTAETRFFADVGQRRALDAPCGKESGSGLEQRRLSLTPPFSLTATDRCVGSGRHVVSVLTCLMLGK